jgi:predicted transcriptional regulator
MASKNLNLTAQIVMSCASRTELTRKELIGGIQRIYAFVSSVDGESVADKRGVKGSMTGEVKKRPIPLKDLVKAKYVVCLECGKKLKALKNHLRKSHGLEPKAYFQKFGIDPKKFPLVCKEYSATRSQIAKDKGLGALGRMKKKAG